MRQRLGRAPCRAKRNACRALWPNRPFPKRVQGPSSCACGKTRVYSATPGPPPPGIAELGPDVWRSDQPLAERGFLALGTPIGTHEFVAAAAEARLGEAQRLLDEIPELPDLQSSWLLQLQCASPRANHLIRTLPPSLSAGYARDHDAAIWRTWRRRGRAGPGTPTGLPPRTARRPWLVQRVPFATGGGRPGLMPCLSCISAGRM